MSIYRDISGALYGRLNAMPSLPPTAYENVGFAPISDTLYLRASHIPAATDTYGLDYAESNSGIFQVDVAAPLNGTGWGECEQMADNVADHFAGDRTLSTSSGALNIRSISRTRGVITDDRYIISVSITYRLLTRR